MLRPSYGIKLRILLMGGKFLSASQPAMHRSLWTGQQRYELPCISLYQITCFFGTIYCLDFAFPFHRTITSSSAKFSYTCDSSQQSSYFQQLAPGVRGQELSFSFTRPLSVIWCHLYEKWFLTGWTWSRNLVDVYDIFSLLLFLLCYK